MNIKLPKPTAKQKSLILSVLAGIGVAVTGIVSAKCAKKTTEDMTVGQKVKTYIPAIVSGGLTIGCIGMSTKISHEEIAAATAACVAIGKRFSDYKKSVEEVVTEEQREQIDTAFYEKEIARLEQELAEREHPTEDEDLVTVVDSFTGYTFKAHKDAVDAGIKKVFKSYEENEYLYWCDIFYIMNDGDTIPHDSELGAASLGSYGYGWSKAMFHDFGCDDGFDILLVKYPNRKNTYILEYANPPEPYFMEY